MDPALAQLGWTDEQWNRICTTVTEEAQRARVAAQILPVVGPEDSGTVAVPRFTLEPDPYAPWPTPQRLTVDSNPTLNLNTISVYVPVRGHEAADPELRAALTMFRRAANYVARLEDTIVFNGRGLGQTPLLGVVAPEILAVSSVSTDATVVDVGILNGAGIVVPLRRNAAAPPMVAGEDLISGVIAAIGALEGRGYLGPFACVLGEDLFTAAHSPNTDYIMPRDRILPETRGPLVRTSTSSGRLGALIAL